MNIPVQISKMHHITRTICGITAIPERALSICQIAFVQWWNISSGNGVFVPAAHLNTHSSISDAP